MYNSADSEEVCGMLIIYAMVHYLHRPFNSSPVRLEGIISRSLGLLFINDGFEEFS